MSGGSESQDEDGKCRPRHAITSGFINEDWIMRAWEDQGRIRVPTAALPQANTILPVLGEVPVGEGDST